jgi:hypothetical protein
MIIKKNKKMIKNKYKRKLYKIYYKKMKLETLQGKPKRKYVRKNKENEEVIQIVQLEVNEEYNIINDLDNEINENLSKCVKKMKLNENENEKSNQKQIFINNFKENKNENLDIIQNNVELISSINRSKPTYVEKVYYNPNVINVKDYEFMTPINVYLYYVSERISKNVIKYILYSHVSKNVDHHILCPITKPNDYNAKESNIKKEEIITLAPNVTLYIREYNQTKRNYSIENCNNSLNKKRKIGDLFDYDFCQLHLETLESKHKNSYIFEHENKYFSFTYDIIDNNIK